jgi:hypothetical protein
MPTGVACHRGPVRGSSSSSDKRCSCFSEGGRGASPDGKGRQTSAGELSWLEFTLVRTVPPHLDKPTFG